MNQFPQWGAPISIDGNCARSSSLTKKILKISRALLMQSVKLVVDSIVSSGSYKNAWRRMTSSRGDTVTPLEVGLRNYKTTVWRIVTSHPGLPPRLTIKLSARCMRERGLFQADLASYGRRDRNFNVAIIVAMRATRRLSYGGRPL